MCDLGKACLNMLLSRVFFVRGFYVTVCGASFLCFVGRCIQDPCESSWSIVISLCQMDCNECLLNHIPVKILQNLLSFERLFEPTSWSTSHSHTGTWFSVISCLLHILVCTHICLLIGRQRLPKHHWSAACSTHCSWAALSSLVPDVQMTRKGL